MKNIKQIKRAWKLLHNKDIFSFAQNWMPPTKEQAASLARDPEFIKRVQTYLAKHYGPQILGPAGVDGKIGRFTSAAIKKFQTDVKINPTGQLDDQTILHFKYIMDSWR